MAESTELETETEHTPEEAAELFRDLADEIESGEDITVTGNNAEITVPGTVEKIDSELEVEHEIRGEYDQVMLELELDWTIIPDEDDDHSEE
ncbi:amphi-Trp domain-containing protein [Halovenus sp. WSH3]|uniref:Amphi-Trp domain-containing protein n=1 Tax=Halovenus carboxidivorans TaxID=2692199 RepID=A0A6B0T442_9EURY|nr:amphi-Trp domain-containing protein [Halovenus carboxidivorans]MXR51787.1 amphi-Trp domain-containing protein [Halovenus carboxidivorans]